MPVRRANEFIRMMRPVLGLPDQVRNLTIRAPHGGAVEIEVEYFAKEPPDADLMFIDVTNDDPKVRKYIVEVRELKDNG